MPQLDIKPTRSELLEVKKKIRLAESGHRLLKKKRDSLIMEFFETVKKVREARNRLGSAYEQANASLETALMVSGRQEVEAESLGRDIHAHFDEDIKNIMGVVTPHITLKSKDAIEQTRHAALSPDLHILDVSNRYEFVGENIVEVATLEFALRRLLDEIERTKRRVNALEFKVIPELQEVAAFIRMRLEEIERENTFRLKKVKAKNAKKKLKQAKEKLAM